ncbi:MAG TPA: LysM peptidoglycan-binding domain-containing protein [Blastocatellia bacterium]|nr:LysM peptidoglycan-binding domain-containing protein [Blastocatellia bacterium]
MGLFDRMFGRGATQAQQQPDANQRFNELRQKYQTVLNSLDQMQVRLTDLHVQDNKLVIKGTAPSDDTVNKVWDQIKAVDPGLNDVMVDISVSQSQAQAATAGGAPAQGSQTYTVKSGDTLSKISHQFYGDANEFMRIFYANRDQLNDPDKIKVGQQLVIPPDDNA